MLTEGIIYSLISHLIGQVRELPVVLMVGEYCIAYDLEKCSIIFNVIKLISCVTSDDRCTVTYQFSICVRARDSLIRFGIISSRKSSSITSKFIIFISTQYLHGYRSCTGTPAAEHCIIFRIYRIVSISASEIYGKEVADKLVLWVCLLILNQNVNYIRKGKSVLQVYSHFINNSNYFGSWWSSCCQYFLTLFIGIIIPWNRSRVKPNEWKSGYDDYNTEQTNVLQELWSWSWVSGIVHWQLNELYLYANRDTSVKGGKGTRAGVAHRSWWISGHLDTANKIS